MSLELNPCPARQAILRVRSLLEEIALAKRRAAFPDQLSGGEQQRVAIVCALAHDPLLVLAGEPTGNLDADTGRSVSNLMQRLLLRAGKTLIMVAHSGPVRPRLRRFVRSSRDSNRYPREGAVDVSDSRAEEQINGRD